MKKFILAVFIMIWLSSCLTEIDPITVDLDYLVRCNTKLIQTNTLDDNTINDVIWGMYSLVTNNESELLVLTNDDKYYYIKNNFIYEHDTLIFMVSDKIYIRTSSNSNVDGWYIYCDDVLYDIIRNKTWYRLCKCSF